MRPKTYKIPLNPLMAKESIAVGLQIMSTAERIGLPAPQSLGVSNAIGILVNGVAIFAAACKISDVLPWVPTDSKENIHTDCEGLEKKMHDGCFGHVNNLGDYHTHRPPIKGKGRLACGLPVDRAKKHSRLMGWAFDGVPYFGPNDVDGEPPTTLDKCSGHNHEPAGYHYHLSADYPYSNECLKACPEPDTHERWWAVMNRTFPKAKGNCLVRDGQSPGSRPGVLRRNPDEL